MNKTEEVYSQLKGKTGLEEEMEKELCRRIAVIEEEGTLVEPLYKSDWIAIIILFFGVGILPVIVAAFMY